MELTLRSMGKVRIRNDNAILLVSLEMYHEDRQLGQRFVMSCMFLLC